MSQALEGHIGRFLFVGKTASTFWIMRVEGMFLTQFVKIGEMIIRALSVPNDLFSVFPEAARYRAYHWLSSSRAFSA